MNDQLAHHPLLRELRQLVAQLATISHVSGTSYEGKVARDTSESIGGRRPPGDDREHPPRAPRKPVEPREDAAQEAWDEYEQALAGYATELEEYRKERDDWAACYQRRTPRYFARQLERCETVERLRELVGEAEQTLKAWRKSPMPSGPEPEFGSPQWPRYIGQSTEDAGVLANRFYVTRRYINKIRQQYREAA